MKDKLIFLTPSQESLLYHTYNGSERNPYLVQIKILSRNKIDKKYLFKAWDLITENNEILRANIYNSADGKLYIKINSNISTNKYYYYTNAITIEQEQTKIRTLIENDQLRKINPFDSNNIFLTLIEKLDGSSIILISYPHYLIGSSSIDLISETLNTYEDLKQQKSSSFIKKSYIDVINNLYVNYNKEQLKYWTTHFYKKEFYSLKPVNNVSKQLVFHYELTFEQTEQLTVFAKKHNLKINHLSQALWALVFCKTFHCSYFSMGIVNSFPKQFVENCLGMFFNTLPVLYDPNNKTFLEYCKDIELQNSEIRQQYLTSLYEIKNWLNLSQKIQLFNVIFEYKPNSYHNLVIKKLHNPGGIKIDFQVDNNFPILIEAYLETTNNLHFKINYDTIYFNEDAIKNLKQLFEDLSSTINKENNRPLLSVLESFPSNLSSNNILSLESTVDLDNQTTTLMRTIWSKVLDISIDELSIDDDFYVLGGDSISAIRIIMQVNQSFQVKANTTQLLKNSTIRSFCHSLGITRAFKLKNYNEKSTTSSKELLELTVMQKSIWFLQNLNKNSPAYSIAMQINFLEEFSLAAIDYAYKKVLNKHAILRASLETASLGNPAFIINNTYEYKVIQHNIENLSEDLLSDYIKTIAHKPFNIEKDKLISLHSFQLSENKSVVLFLIHHIIFDEYSIKIFLKSLEEYYLEYIAGNISINDSNNDFKYLNNSLIYKSPKPEYIKSIYNSLTKFCKSSLPIDYAKNTSENFAGKRYKFNLDNIKLAKFREILKFYKATLFEGLLTIFSIVMARYLREENIIISTPLSLRNKVEYENTIGLFINIIPIFVTLAADKSFIENLRAIKKNIYQSYEYQHISFFDIVNHVKPERNLFINPIFQVMLVLQDEKIYPTEFANKAVTINYLDLDSSKLDLTLFVTPKATITELMVEYNTNLYDKQTINNFVNYFVAQIEYTNNFPDISPFLCPLISIKDQKQLTRTKFNSVCENISDNLNTLLSNNVSIYSNNKLFFYQNSSITYIELVLSINNMSANLISKGITHDDIILIYQERSIAYIILLMALAKIQATYVSADLRWGKQRISEVIIDCQPKLIITDDQYAALLPRVELPILNIEELTTNNVIDHTISVNNVKRDHILCILYTSGSTGKPKGIQIYESAVINVITTISETINIQENDKILGLTSFCFDISLFEILCPFIKGCSCFIYPDMLLNNEINTIKFINSNSISVLQVTPTHLQLLLNADFKPTNSLKLLTTGEALKRPLATKLLEFIDDFWNLYGPTETTIWATAGHITKDSLKYDFMPIGTPISGNEVYVFDNHMLLTPQGMLGELYIGGKYLTKGYLNRSELNKQKFVEIPPCSGNYFFKTGDLIRILPDGNFTFISRIDDQIKISGFRIQTHEIEARLRQHITIKDVFVYKEELTDYDANLVACIVPKSLNNLTRDLINLQFYQSFTNNWQDVWNSFYKNETAILSNKYIGWKDSFTGNFFSENTMAIWLNSTIERIRQLQPKNVLEIGCGNGLILFELINNCENYYGSDISQNALEYIKSDNRYKSVASKISLVNCSADNLALLENNEFDLVIFNSVIQYFPSIDYLNLLIVNIITKNVQPIKIFIGDIRNYDLLKNFYESKYKKYIDDYIVHQLIFQETELAISQQYFTELMDKYPKITGLEIQLKRGHEVNELTCFRYDVTIYINQPIQKITNAKVVVCNKLNIDLYFIRENLIYCSDIAVRFTNLVNSRVAPHNNGFNPEDLYILAEQLNYKLFLNWENTGKDITKLDATFVKQNHVTSTINYDNSVNNKPIATSPLQYYRYQTQLDELRNYISQQIPYYMLPRKYVFLSYLPTNINGKIDKITLVNLNKLNYKNEYTAPSTAIETAIQKIWEKYLLKSNISCQDNFFDIGGNSLMAIRIINDINSAFTVNLLINTLFIAQTIATLSQIVNNYLKNFTSFENNFIVVLNKINNEQPPIFCIHPLGGTVFCYQELAKHFKRNVYGIQDPQIDNMNLQFNSIEDLAQYYCQAIFRLYQGKIFTLIALSSGAQIAHAMTCYLKKQSYQKINLIFLDGWAKLSNFYLEKLATINLSNLEEALKEIPAVKSSYLRDLIYNRIKLLCEYKMETINHDLTLIKASIELPQFAKLINTTNDWDQYYVGNITTHSIIADHYSLLNHENIHVLHNIIQPTLQVEVSPEPHSVPPHYKYEIS